MCKGSRVMECFRHMVRHEMRLLRGRGTRDKGTRNGSSPGVLEKARVAGLNMRCCQRYGLSHGAGEDANVRGSDNIYGGRNMQASIIVVIHAARRVSSMPWPVNAYINLPCRGG